MSSPRLERSDATPSAPSGANCRSRGSHPVVLVPGTFIAVGGRGPTDSNESGKTSFLAAASLLLGDPGWGMTGGGPSWVADLLFEPRTAGVHSESYPPARHGYIVGAFCEPQNPDDTVMTVWCRLNATAEYFQVRYADGVASGRRRQ
jgi:chromosome segregation protein